jgi:hypothetical protein
MASTQPSYLGQRMNALSKTPACSPLIQSAGVTPPPSPLAALQLLTKRSAATSPAAFGLTKLPADQLAALTAAFAGVSSSGAAGCRQLQGMDAGQQLLQWTATLAAGAPLQLTAAHAPWLTSPAAFLGPQLSQSAAAAAASSQGVAQADGQAAAPAAGLPAQGQAATALLAGSGPAGDSASAEQLAAAWHAAGSNQLLVIHHTTSQPWNCPLASLLVDGGGEPLGGGGYGQVLQAQYQGWVGGDGQHGGRQMSDHDNATLYPAAQLGQLVALKRMFSFSELPPEARFSSAAQYQQRIMGVTRNEARISLVARGRYVAVVFGWGFMARGKQALQLLPPTRAAGEQLDAAAEAAAGQLWWQQVLAANLDPVIIMQLYPRGSLDKYVAQLPGGCMDHASAQTAARLMALCLWHLHKAGCIHR